jgi:Peptidase A4 family
VSGYSRQSDILSLIRTYRSPPEGFDPRKAVDKELRRHGLPRRPDLEREPHLALLWTRMSARPTTFVEAKLAIDPFRNGRDPRGGQGFGYGPTGWAGVVREITQGIPTTMERTSGVQISGMRIGVGPVAWDYTEPATMVFAQWVVPEVLDYHPADQNLNIGFWVGLDGWGSDQLLQAGIAANLGTSGFFDFGSDLSWYAWIEWWTEEFKDPAVQVTNFPVAPGDTVFVLVCAPEPDFGFASMLNVSRGHGTSVGIRARPGITSSGKTAEWIVEAPTQSPALPYFSPVTFYECGAGSLHQLFHLMPGGMVTEITAPNPSYWGPGPEITRTFVASPTIAVVEWRGFGEVF